MLLFFPIFIFAQLNLVEQSLLFHADSLSTQYQTEIAKLPSPSSEPQPTAALNVASIWFTIDLNEISSHDTLVDEAFWETLREIGVQGVFFKNLKQGGMARTSFGLNPKWDFFWNQLASILQKKGITLIGSSIGNSTGLTTDFFLALKNDSDYAGLYHLIEIKKKDWKLLPKVASRTFAVNIPWLTLQELQKKGYVPEKFTPYVKASSWNATAAVKGYDGTVRRWIYLKENRLDPVIDWLNPSFAGYRIAFADILESVYPFGKKIIQIESTNASDMLALWTRKLGSFSVFNTQGSFFNVKNAKTDLCIDHLTRSALIHALIFEDAQMLRFIYQLFLDENIKLKRLVHCLQPLDQFSCDWAELIDLSNMHFQYEDEILTGKALRSRLLKKDLDRLGNVSEITWPTLCMKSLDINNAEKHHEKILKAHTLLAQFYAMQPGAFSFSSSDLLGMTQAKQIIDLMAPNENSLYGSLPSQMMNQCSFARRLRKIFSIRNECGIAQAELVAVPNTDQKEILLLLFQNQNQLQLLAINFAKTQITQRLEIPAIRDTTAIDLVTGLAENKAFLSTSIQINLPPLSAKSILFQQKID